MAIIRDDFKMDAVLLGHSTLCHAERQIFRPDRFCPIIQSP